MNRTRVALLGIFAVLVAGVVFIAVAAGPRESAPPPSAALAPPEPPAAGKLEPPVGEKAVDEGTEAEQPGAAT